MPARKPKPADPQSQELLRQLGARIRALRLKKGYDNHEKFANDINISRGQYWRYEKGQNLNFTSLVKVVRAMGMTLEEFFREGFER